MKLQEWRKQNGLGQTKVAKLLGITQANLSAYENGRYIPGGKMLARIQRLTDNAVTAVDFVDEDGNAITPGGRASVAAEA